MNERDRTRRRTPLTRTTALVLSWVLSSMAFVGEVAAFAPTAPVPAAPAPQAPLVEDAPPPAAPAASAAPVGLAPKRVKPILECVIRHSPGSYTAYYGYDNQNAYEVTIPVGADNYFDPGAQDRGQPTVFQPGRTPEYPNALFSVPFGPNKLHWSVRGPDGQLRTVTASGGSPYCPTDRTPPKIAITSPADGSTVGATPLFRVVYDDPSGIQTSSFSALVDGVDRSASFTVGPTEATWTPTRGDALGSGPHDFTASIQDTLRNAAKADSKFMVDATTPVVVIASPAEGSYHRTTPTLTGTVQDEDTQTAVVCRRGATTVPATVSWSGTTGSFSCAVPLQEGANEVVVEATDTAGRTGSATRHLQFDSIAPQVTILEPSPDSYTAATSITVSGGVVDASPITSLRVQGVTATVTGGTFTATGVPVGAGPNVTLTAEAEDAAGNTGTGSQTIHVDRVPPVVVIQTPAPGAVVPGRTVEVTGTVTETSPFTVDVNGEPATVTGQAFSGSVTATVGGPLTLTVTARDAAAQTGTAAVSVVVDRTAPQLSVTSPASGLVTREPSVTVAGTVTDDSAVALTVDGASVPVVAGAFSYEKSLPSETSYEIEVVATDAAGRSVTETVSVRVDRTPPQVVVAIPAAGSLVTAFPVAVSGTVQDASTVELTVEGTAAVVTRGAWTASVPSLGAGSLALHVVAVDAAGNQTVVDHPVVVDLGAPAVTITAPAPGALTSAATVTVEGTVAEDQLTGVVVRGVAAVVTPDGPGLWRFAAAGVPLDEGVNLLQAVATDAAGQTGSATVEVTRDSTPPQLSLQAPDSALPGAVIAVEAFPTDASGIARVDLFLGEALVASVDAPPYATPVTIPAGTPSGTTLVVRATAVDLAGNQATASRGVAVASNGIVAGQVLSDATSLPIEGAGVRLLSGTPFETATDARGRYSVPVAGAQALLAASRDGHVTVERATAVAPGAGTIPVDARLTPLAAPVAIGPDGGSLQVEVERATSAAPVTMRATVTVPAGAVAADAAFRLTALSAQGLPNLLPLGWAPVLAVDLRADAPVAGPLEAALTGLPAGPLHLASYSATLHGWLMVDPALDPTSGALALTLPSPGAYALVRADEVEPALPLPAPGAPLPSAAFVAIPDGAASTSTVTPDVLPPTGGTARGALTVTSPAALPSGTVVQAEVTETFTLVAGPVVSEEVRTQDLLLARDAAGPDAPLRAEVPITAARTFGAGDLVEGRVHLDILAGREGIRGATGGQQPVTVTDGDAMLRVPAGALPEDTVVSLDAVPLSPYLPQVAGVTAVAEVLVGLEGRTLALAAELSVSGASVPAGETLWLARIERPGGVPYAMVVGRAELVSGRVVTTAAPGLPGLRTEGRYVFFRTSRPVGFVTGVTSTSAGPIGALVQTAALPFVGISGGDGAYTVLAEAGSVVVSARALATAQAGSETVELQEGASASVDILLAGVQTVATVTPADGTTSVPTGARVEIRASAALAPASVTADTVRLIGPAPVPLRFLLSASGKLLLAIPEEPLLPDTEYTLVVSGLLDLAGVPVAVPATSFRTKDDTPPVYDTDRIVFSFPDANGQVRVEAPPGSMPSGTEILIINSGNGVVVTFTFLENGSVSGEFPATLNDQLLVTITDPFGNVTTFQRSQYVAPDGTTAVGAGGGTVEAEDGSELRLPPGATPQAVRLKLTPFDETAPQAQQKPSFGTDGNGNPLAHFGAGLTIESPDKPTFAKEVDIAFPLPEGLPENPNDAFFYVFRRLTGPNGEVLNEVIDQAFVEGEGAERKVVTASFPFLGFVATAGLVANHFFMMYTYNALLPGAPLPGSVTGKVLRAVWPEGASQPTFVPVTNGTTRVRIASPGPGQEGLVAAVHPVTGTFTLWDTTYTGGNIDVTATLTNAAGQVETVTGTAVEANPANWATTGLRFYRNIATVNLTFPLEPSSGTPPTLAIALVNTATGQQVAGGIVPEGTPLKAVLTATNATLGAALLQGLACTVTHPDPTDLTRGEVDLAPGSACPVNAAGSYTLTASANPAQGAPLTATRSLLVVVAGGGNTEVIEGVAPTVVDAQPGQGATGVPVTTLPQLVFSEPVTGIGPGVLTLHEMVDGVPGPEVSLTPVAVLRNGTVVQNPTVDAQVVSLTARPLASLRYGTSYRLALGSGVADLDANPGPRELAPPTEWTFRTFAPTGVGGSEEDFGSAGITLIDDRAFLAEITLGGGNVGYQGQVRAFDLSDPQLPVEITGAREVLTQRPVDLWAREGGDTGRDELAVGVTITAASKPSNLHLYDVQDRENSQWVGVTSVSNSTLDGILHRVVFQGRYVYVLTQRKGIQVVDTEEAKRLFVQQAGGGDPSSPQYHQMIAKIHTEGQGFGQGAIVATIPYRYDQTEQWQLWDLDVASLNVGGVVQPIAFSVGEQRLANDWYMVSANPQAIARLATTPLTGPGGVLFRGRQMALGRQADRDLAVVVGTGPFGPSAEEALGLRIFDVTNPVAPLPRGFLVFADLEGFSGDVTDVQIKGDKALVAGTEGVVLVSIADVTQPQVVGVVTGAGGRLAVGDGDLDGLLFSTARSVFGGSTPLGGVQTNALDKVTLVTSVKENPVILAENRRSVEPQVVKVRVIPVPDQILSAEVEVLRNSTPVQTQAVQLTPQGTGTVTLAAGLEHTANATMRAQLVVNRSDPGRPHPLPRRLESEALTVSPSTPEELEIGEALEVTGSSPALLLRRRRPNPPAFPQLTWSAPGILVPWDNGQQTGVYATDVRPYGPAGDRGSAQLFMGTTLMGQTGALTFHPGQPFAASGTLVALPPPQAPTVTPGLIPADGTTVIRIVLDGVRDSSGNIPENGTRIAWSVEGFDGELQDHLNSVLVGGHAEVSFRAGIEPGLVKIRAGAGEGDFRFEKDIDITQVPLEVTISGTWPLLEARADSDAGAAAEGTAVVWGTNRGRVTYQEVLADGRSLGTWDSSNVLDRPYSPFPRYANLFATIGRARGSFTQDLQEAPQSGPVLLLNRDRILSDVPVGASLEVGPFEAQATATVVGEPNQTVRLVLGSTRFVATEPAAAFSLDAIEDGETADLYEGPAATVAPQVELDTSDPTHLPSFRFDGGGGLTLAGSALEDLQSRFGFNLWVRFDSLDDQQIVEKAGSYGLRLIEQSGERRLEFYAFESGALRRVVSHRAIAVDTWYQVAAQVEDGRLRIVLDDDVVDLGDTIGSVDLSAGDLALGSTLHGNLDEVALYDLTRAPLMAFENGSTVADVTLGPDGRAEVEIRSAASFPALATRGLAAEVQPTGAFAERLRILPVRVYEAPEPTNPNQIREPLFLDTYLRGIFGEAAQECAEGLASGESETFAGVGCDLSAGFIPGVGAVQSVRDGYVVTRAFVRGKRDLGTYIKAGVTLVSLAALAVPGARSAKGVYERARLAATGVQAEARITREALHKVGRIVGEGVQETDSIAVRILADEAGDAEAKGAVRAMLGVCGLSITGSESAVGVLPGCGGLTDEGLRMMNSIAERYGPDGPRVVKAFGRVQANEGFGVDILERMLRSLDLETFHQLRLTDDAIEGLAVFLKHTKSPNRLPNIWRELTQVMQPPLGHAAAQEVVERMGTMLKAGDDRLRVALAALPEADRPALLANWHNFIARGAGTSARRRSTAGFFHHLDNLLREPFENVRVLDGSLDGFVGRPDLILSTPAGLVQKEFKNIAIDRLLAEKDLAQLRNIVGAAKKRASTQPIPIADAVAAELSRINYVFRGPFRQELKDQIYKEAKDLLKDLGEAESARAAKALHDAVQFPGGQTIPF